MRNKAEYGKIVLRVFIFCILIYLIKKVGLFFIPNEKEMAEFQFNMITVSTVFAGFSFTVLGMLLQMFSEPMMKELKDTGIVTEKSKRLMMSVIYFCVSGILSLLFIVKIDQYVLKCIPKAEKFVEIFFIIGTLFLIMGIMSFIASTLGVFQLITKVYGYDKSKYKFKKKEYQKEIAEAKKRLNN